MLNVVQQFKLKQFIKKAILIVLALFVIFFFIMSLKKFFTKGHVTAIYYLLLTFTSWTLLKEVLLVE